MNTKNKLMIMFCILSWVFCSIGILVRQHSIVGWWITFSMQIVCLIAVIVLGIITAIELKREWKELDRKHKENEKYLEELIKGWLALKLEEDKDETTLEPPEEIEL